MQSQWTLSSLNTQHNKLYSCTVFLGLRCSRLVYNFDRLSLLTDWLKRVWTRVNEQPKWKNKTKNDFVSSARLQNSIGFGAIIHFRIAFASLSVHRFHFRALIVYRWCCRSEYIDVRRNPRENGNSRRRRRGRVAEWRLCMWYYTQDTITRHNDWCDAITNYMHDGVRPYYYYYSRPWCVCPYKRTNRIYRSHIYALHALFAAASGRALCRVEERKNCFG